MLFNGGPRYNPENQPDLPPCRCGEDAHRGRCDSIPYAEVDVHNIFVTEHGANASILYATCSCGWSGPPRRSMAKIIEDTAKHRPPT